MSEEEVTVVAAHSFLVRVWSEYRSAQGRAIPRGHIVHVLDDARAPVSAFIDIVGFIESYLSDAPDPDANESAP
ncbi:hypothetical protein ACNO8X_01120 [Mycobacterium sp. PDNC021]|uniref:hypothetical protein n=1 Tax=Mycobacterium sp. PDNC021 TaxID=3391399 RepID=UPI003AAF3BFD